MTDDTTRANIEAFYKAYAAGDVGTVGAMLHDDIDWIIYGPVQVFPFTGPRRGKQAVLDALAGIAKEFALERYVPEAIVVAGDRVAVLSSAAFVQRSTSRTLSLRLADFIRLSDGKIVEFRELFDSFDAVEQALGRWLEV